MDEQGGNKLSAAEVPSPSAHDGGALSEFLRLSRNELQGLMEKSHEIQQASLRSVNASFEELHARLCQELGEASATFVAETRSRALQETSSSLELFDVEASARMSSRLDETLERARVACSEMEQTFKEQIEQHCKDTLTKLLDSSVKELQDKADSMLEGIRAESKNSLAALRSEAASEISEQIRKATGGLADDLQNRADKAYAAVNSRLMETGKALVAHHEKQISALSEAAMTTVGQQAEAVQRKTSEILMHDLRKRLDPLTIALQHLESHDSDAGLTKRP
jgi:hypothetical protein